MEKLIIWCYVFCSFFGFAHSQCSANNLVTTDSLTATRALQTFSSPGWKVSYYSNMDCKWLISAGNGERVVVDMREYIIEDGEGPECVYDFLQFFDGSSTSGEAVTVCGTARQGRMFVSTGKDALIRLKSDYSLEMAGFTMRYFIGKTEDQGGCASTIVTLTPTSTVQYLTNKQWPDSYDEPSTCQWLIRSTAKVEIQILFSDLMSGEECFSDTLDIYDGSDATAAPLTQTFCDSRDIFPSRNTLTFLSSGADAFVKFNSIASGWRRHGFVLSFRQEGPSATTTPAPSTTTTQPPNDVCSSGTIQLTATNDTQFIQSPSYPIFYSPNLVCSWLIEGPEGSVIQLKVIDSYLEDSEGCIGDSVNIHDGGSGEAAVIATYCGEISSSVNSTSNKLYIIFRSDGSVGQRGFHLEYTALSNYSAPSCVPQAGVTNLVANSTAQYFESPNYPNNYDNSTTVYWLIHNPTDSGYIKLEVEDSRIEANPSCSYDKVTVYRGPCTTYPVLDSFCGVERPTITQYTGSYVLVSFVTDATAEFKGFRIKYYVTTEREKESTFWQDVALIAGVTVAAIVAVGLIVGLAVAAKKGKLPGMKSGKPEKRRLSVSSVSSSSSDSDSDNEAKKKRRPKTALRSKTKVKLPPVQSSNVEKLPTLPISKQGKLPPIAKISK